MISAPRPHKTNHLNLKDAPHPRSRASLASSFTNNNTSSTTRAILRSHSLPTPALSPAPSLSASQSSSSASASASTFSSPLVNMLTLASPPAAAAAGSFAHLAIAPGRSFSPFASAVNSSKCAAAALRQSMSGHVPVTPDASCLALPVSMCMLEPELESKPLDLDLLESFRATKSRVLRLSGIPSSSSSPDSSARAARAVASLFPADDASNRPPAIPTPVRMWTLRANANVMAMDCSRDGDERPVWAVFTSHEEACTVLTIVTGFGSGGYGHGYDSGLGCLRSTSASSLSVDVMPALESELEPFSKLQPFNLNLISMTLDSATAVTDKLHHFNLNHSTQPAIAITGGGMQQQSLMRYPPSPTSSTATDPETEAELFFPDAQDDLRFAHSLSLNSNYPSRSFGVGHGHSYDSANAYAARSMTPATNTIDALQSMHACGFTLSSNPPKPRTGFRHGDWICADPVCAAHNFGRNVMCIQCAAPRPSNLDIAVGGGGGYAPLNCSNGPLNGQNGSFSPLTARNLSPRFVANTANMTGQAQTPQQRQYQQQHELLLKAQMQTHAQAQTHPLLTPSGRAFAVGGKVQNISPDPLAPCIMFWPDNEPFPEPGQIRPASLSNIAHPPIMNTGNKGPIERQPGDWVCHKCNYLNWRRRKVCQTCFPYAEGNGDSVSATMHAERLALLAAVYGQVHPQLANHAQASQNFPGRAQNLNGAHQAPVPTASTQYCAASSSVISPSGHPFTTTPSALHRSQSPSARAPALRTQIPPPLSVAPSVNNSRSLAGMNHSGRHPQSTAEASSLGTGNIVYETPPSPAVVRPPPSISSALAHGPRTSSSQTFSPTRAGPLLPSFLKHEAQAFHPGPRHVPNAISTVPAPIGTGTRSPASLSPVSSSTSADLPLEEHAGPAKSVGVIGSGRNASFYAHPRGAGSGSSMGSSSSLTLAAGSSIWSLERDEDKAWKSDASSALDAFKGLAL